MIPRQQRHSRSLHQRLSRRLRSHGTHGGSRRSHKNDPRGRTSIRKVSVLRKKTIARMDRLRPRLPRGLNNPADIQIALPGGRRPYGISAIRRLHMQRPSICLRVNRDRFDPKPPRRPSDPAGDFTTIGDQQRTKHPRHIRNTPKRVSCSGLFSAAESDSPSTRRLSAGSMIPSSQSRALA